VAAVGGGAARTYLNFGQDWHTDFTVEIERKDKAAFASAGIDLGALAAKRIRVRGWIEWRNGPMIRASHPSRSRCCRRMPRPTPSGPNRAQLEPSRFRRRHVPLPTAGADPPAIGEGRRNGWMVGSLT
jgi:hypothetical protein